MKVLVVWHGLVLVFLLFSVLACTDELSFRGLNFMAYEGWQTDFFTQTQLSGQYDFLWIVDNSGSMSNIRDFMSQKLNDFVGILESRQAIDWQMAVTITDRAVANGDLMSASDGTRVVKRSMPNAAARWQSILNGISSTMFSYWEQGLESAHQAIALHGSEFSRPGVPLVVTYLSDEQDYSCETNCNYGMGSPEGLLNVGYFPVSRYANQFQQLKNQSGTDVILYPIVQMMPLNQPNSNCDDTVGSQGLRYLELQTSVGSGQALSLCSSELAASFDSVAQLTANLGVCFTLTRTVATEEGMAVTVNGLGVPKSAVNGFVFEPAANQVCFSGIYIPPNGASIEVFYSRTFN